MLTSGEHLGDLARCQELGISAFLTKPIRRAELRAAILNAIADQDRGGQTAQDLRALAGKTAELTSASSGAHILLAEDNVVNQRVARAVRMWEKEPFDLILMDVQMPDVDGFEATGLIRKKEKSPGRTCHHRHDGACHERRPRTLSGRGNG